MIIRQNYDDNIKLLVLLGNLNSNLDLIEELFNIEALHKGNEVLFKGEKAQQASDFVQLLYKYIDKNNCLDRVLIKSFYDNWKKDLPLQTKLYNKKIEADINNMQSAGIKTKRKVIFPKTVNQSKYIESIDRYNIVFGVGPAGTGKTYLAVAKAVESFLKGEVEKIVLCRPAVEAGENLGYLPGSMEDKINPYLRPLYDALENMIPDQLLSKYIEQGKIEIASLAYMRGRTLQNSFIIIDEAQNATLVQLKMLLTRIGNNSKMLITGDLTQIDLKNIKDSGLTKVMEILKSVKEIKQVYLETIDIVRSDIVSKIVEAFEKHR